MWTRWAREAQTRRYVWAGCFDALEASVCLYRLGLASHLQRQSALMLMRGIGESVFIRHDVFFAGKGYRQISVGPGGALSAELAERLHRVRV